jgi:hypothetical protein
MVRAWAAIHPSAVSPAHQTLARSATSPPERSRSCPLPGRPGSRRFLTIAFCLLPFASEACFEVDPTGATHPSFAKTNAVPFASSPVRLPRSPFTPALLRHPAPATFFRSVISPSFAEIPTRKPLRICANLVTTSSGSESLGFLQPGCSRSGPVARRGQIGLHPEIQAPLTGSHVGQALSGSQANAGSVQGSPGDQKIFPTQICGVPGGGCGSVVARQLQPRSQEHVPPHPSSPHVVPSQEGVHGKRGPENPLLAAFASSVMTSVPATAPAPRPNAPFKT